MRLEDQSLTMTATHWKQNTIIFVVSAMRLASNEMIDNGTHLLQEVHTADVWLDRTSQ